MVTKPVACFVVSMGLGILDAEIAAAVAVVSAKRIGLVLALCRTSSFAPTRLAPFVSPQIAATPRIGPRSTEQSFHFGHFQDQLRWVASQASAVSEVSNHGRSALPQ